MPLLTELMVLFLAGYKDAAPTALKTKKKRGRLSPSALLNC
jgi:hypothetical protein